MPRLCLGLDASTPCIFDRIFPGQRAPAQGDHQQCRFCDLELLEESLRTPAGFGTMLAQLRWLRQHYEIGYDTAMARIGELTPDLAEIEQRVLQREK